jgi:glycerate 2-kinase
MRVVVAPDKFKGCLAAGEVAAAVADGLSRGRPDLDIVRLPVADGGDGTVDAAVSAGFTRVSVPAVGPTGEAITASYAVQGTSAVVELAEVVGLARLPGGVVDPMGSSTYGLGLVLRAAIAGGARSLVLGVGGSASTDGGAGLVQALGGHVTDAQGDEIAPGGGHLGEAVALDLRDLRATLGEARIVVASDVDNPLLGPTGAAMVFGPQKGATPEQVAALEAGLRHWSGLVAEATGRDDDGYAGAGAAGGTGFAALALLAAKIKPGIELMLDLLGFERAIAGADLVVTGEGSLDEQSLSGKAPIGVARAAAKAGVPVVVVAGRSLLDPERLAEAGISAAYPLSDLEPDPARSMANAASLLVEVGERIAAEWLA